MYRLIVFKRRSTVFIKRRGKFQGGSVYLHNLFEIGLGYSFVKLIKRKEIGLKKGTLLVGNKTSGDGNYHARNTSQ